MVCTSILHLVNGVGSLEVRSDFVSSRVVVQSSELVVNWCEPLTVFDILVVEVVRQIALDPFPSVISNERILVPVTRLISSERILVPVRCVSL